MNGVLSIDPGLHACGAAIFDTAASNNLIWSGLIKNKVAAHLNNPTYYSTLWRGMADSVDEKLYSMFGREEQYHIDQMALELPQVYVASRSKGDPNDLIALAGLVGALAHWFRGTVFTYSPHAWKHTVPKKIMNARILKRLSHEEQGKIEKAPEGLMHNVLDGIGLGLWHLKRL